MKACCPVLLPYLGNLFNQSSSTGTYPKAGNSHIYTQERLNSHHVSVICVTGDGDSSSPLTKYVSVTGDGDTWSPPTNHVSVTGLPQNMYLSPVKVTLGASQPTMYDGDTWHPPTNHASVTGLSPNMYLSPVTVTLGAPRTNHVSVTGDGDN